MNEVYIVEAHFDDYESSWWTTIGIFTDMDIAESVKQKWEDFFISNKKMFDEPKDFIPSNDEDWGIIDEWKDSKEYYEILGKYGDIKSFTSTTVNVFTLNTDTFISNAKNHRGEAMINLMKQWDRDYKINNIL